MFEAIQVNNAYKKFGNASPPLWKSKAEPSKTGKVVKVAVDHVTFSVHEAEIFGVWGPNGSGKSTLIRLIATLLLPDAGSITVFGHDVVSQSMEVQRLINRVSVEASFFKKLSPMKNLLYGARLYGMEGKETRRKVVEILTRLGLEKNTIRQPMEEMSRGMQQKVAIARALLSKPRLLLLDKPTIYVLWVSHEDDILDDHFKQRGYRRRRGYAHLARSLDETIPLPQVADGFQMRSCRGVLEVTDRAKAQFGAFNSSAPFERYMERFSNFMRSPVYDPELDIVAVAPDGQVGAFCIVWTDPLNQVGHFEPVCTHPDFSARDWVEPSCRRDCADCRIEE